MIAITRDVSPSVNGAELTHIDRVPIDYRRAVEQHEQYRALLRSLGCEVIDLPADPNHPEVPALPWDMGLLLCERLLDRLLSKR